MGRFYRFEEMPMVPMGNETAELDEETKSPAEAGLAQ